MLLSKPEALERLGHYLAKREVALFADATPTLVCQVIRLGAQSVLNGNSRVTTRDQAEKDLAWFKNVTWEGDTWPNVLPETETPRMDLGEIAARGEWEDPDQGAIPYPDEAAKGTTYGVVIGRYPEYSLVYITDEMGLAIKAAGRAKDKWHLGGAIVENPPYQVTDAWLEARGEKPYVKMPVTGTIFAEAERVHRP